MLSLQQCKNLAEWGMPQERVLEHEYYIHEDGQLKPYREPHEKSYRIPDLQEMIEFAAGLSSSLWCDVGFFDRGDDAWSATAPVNDGDVHAWSDTPEQAVYALIEKLQEERNDG